MTYLFWVDELDIQVTADLHADVILRDRRLGSDSDIPLTHVYL